MKIIKSKKNLFNMDIYTTDTGCQILLGKDGGLWHLSISHTTRDPSWDEIKQVRYRLLPRDKNIAMLLPPSENYVNLDEHCFHLYEMAKSELPQI